MNRPFILRFLQHYFFFIGFQLDHRMLAAVHNLDQIVPGPGFPVT